MKRYRLYFIIPLLLSCSAEPVRDDVKNLDDFVYVAGGYEFGEIYVYKNGEITPAHNYIHETQAESHTCTLNFISFGIYGVKDLSSNNQIKIKLAYPPTDKVYLDCLPSSQFNRYLQEVGFILPENLSVSAKDYKFRIISDGFNGFAADITIRQVGK